MSQIGIETDLYDGVHPSVMRLEITLPKFWTMHLILNRPIKAVQVSCIWKRKQGVKE